MTEELHDEYQVCYKHPDRKTLLRCNKCNRPICLECAVQTPTGYRCKDCIKSQQKNFDTAEAKDYVIGAVIAFILTEDMRLPMTLIDKWTPLMLILLVICWVLDVRLMRYRDEVPAEEEERAEEEKQAQPV